MVLIQISILKRIAIQTVILFVVIGCFVTMTQVLNQLRELIQSSSNLMVAVRLFGLLVPTMAVIVFPLAFLIACINVFDAMDEDRETVITLGAGAPHRLLLFPVRVLAAGFAALILLVSVLVEPAANRAARDTIASLRVDAIQVVASNGLLREPEPGLFVRAGVPDADGRMPGIFILDRREASRETVYIAEAGQFGVRDGRVYLEMFGGRIEIRDADGNPSYKLSFDRYVADPEDFFADAPPWYGARQTATRSLWDDVISGTAPASRRKELIRRLSDWLYVFAFAAVVSMMIRNAPLSRTAPGWRLPVALLLCCVLRAAGLVFLGKAGTGSLAAALCFALPVGGAVLFTTIGHVPWRGALQRFFLVSASRLARPVRHGSSQV